MPCIVKTTKCSSRKSMRVQIKGKKSHFTDWKTVLIKMSVLSKMSYRFTVSNKTPMIWFWQEIEKRILEVNGITRLSNCPKQS